MEINNYPNYLIFDDGRVFSKKNKIFLSLCYNHDGYQSVTLYFEGKQERHLVHRLVGRAYLPNPNNYPQINHINGIRDDNRKENLEWVTILINSQSINKKMRILDVFIWITEVEILGSLE